MDAKPAKIAALEYLVDKLGQLASGPNKEMAAEFSDLQAEFSRRRARALRQVTPQNGRPAVKVEAEGLHA